jgi:hypothetical protein
MTVKRALLVLGLLAVVFVAIFAIVRLTSGEVDQAVLRHGAALEDLSLTLEEMERGFPGLVDASVTAMTSMRAKADAVARAQPLAASGTLDGIEDGYRFAALVLEGSVALLQSSALALQSERQALDLLRESQRALANRASGDERDQIASRLTQVDGSLQAAEAATQHVGPLAEKSAAQVAGMLARMRNLLALSANEPDLRDRLTLLVQLLEWGGESTDQVRKVHAFCANFAKRLRDEEGVQRSLIAVSH